MASVVSLSDSDDVNKEIQDAYDPKLDFFSVDFDPLKALETEGIKAPIPDAKIYDNIAKYHSVYSCVVSVNKKKADKAVAECSNVRRFQDHQLPVQGKRRDVSRKNIFSQMELIEGPLKLLKKCKDDRIRIKVYTRHGYGVRGYITGFVTAFDKFWNISLEDVYEKWTRARKRKSISYGELLVSEDVLKCYETVTPPKINVLSVDKKTETCSRQLDQLLLRGEQIMIIVVDSGENVMNNERKEKFNLMYAKT